MRVAHQGLLGEEELAEIENDWRLGERYNGTIARLAPQVHDLIAALRAARDDDPEGGETCQVCGRRYATVYEVPGEVWQHITPKVGETGLLCLRCADKRATDLGIELFWSAGVGDYPSAALRARDEELVEAWEKYDGAIAVIRQLRTALGRAPEDWLKGDDEAWMAYTGDSGASERNEVDAELAVRE